MTTTALSLYQKMAEAVGGYISGTTTSAGDSTSLISTDLCVYPDDDERIVEAYALMTSGTYDGSERPITMFTQVDGDCTFRYALAGAPGNGKTFVIHPWSVTKMMEKLNKAIFRTKYLFQTILDDNTATVSSYHHYDIPSTIIDNPREIWISTHLVADITAATEEWTQLHYWIHDPGNDQVYFPYELPAGRTLRMIGAGYVKSSNITAETDTVSCVEPDVQHLIALALYYMYTEEFIRGVGGDRDEMRDIAAFWLQEAERTGKEIKLSIPRPTQQCQSFTFYGGM